MGRSTLPCTGASTLNGAAFGKKSVFDPVLLVDTPRPHILAYYSVLAY